MKLFIVILTMFFSLYSNAESAQILRANVDKAHFNPASFRGGVMELTSSETIKLNIDLEANSGEEKQLEFELEVTDIIADECGTITYVATTDDAELMLIDRRSANFCDEIHLHLTTLVYTTNGADRVHTSAFDGQGLTLSLIHI